MAGPRAHRRRGRLQARPQALGGVGVTGPPRASVQGIRHRPPGEVNPDREMTPIERRVLEVLDRQPVIAEAVAERTGLSIPQALGALRGLRDLGYVESWKRGTNVHARSVFRRSQRAPRVDRAEQLMAALTGLADSDGRVALDMALAALDALDTHYRENA